MSDLVPHQALVSLRRRLRSIGIGHASANELLATAPCFVTRQPMTSIAHKEDPQAHRFHPDGLAPWEDPRPPEKTGRSRIGRLRCCAYCGSMHPAEVAAAILAGAKGEWADRKYGWPHKAYFHGVPNPHAGLLEVRGSSNFPQEGYIQDETDPTHWHEVPRPAGDLTDGKFYTVHLRDATPAELAIIEVHLGLHFDWLPEGRVKWSPVEKPST